MNIQPVATSSTPQIVTLVIDDSQSMRSPARNFPCRIVAEAVEDLIITAQSASLGTSGFRYLLNICKFGDMTYPLVVVRQPDEIDMESPPTFNGDSGTTMMAPALDWARDVTLLSIERCRALPTYDEERSPGPLVLFFSDGAPTDPHGHPVVTGVGEFEVRGLAVQAESHSYILEGIFKAADRLKSIPFRGAAIQVAAVGIDMDAASFAIMRLVASNPDLAVNIGASEISGFLANPGVTRIGGSPQMIQGTEQIPSLRESFQKRARAG